MPVALLERDDELALLTAALDRAVAGTGGAVVLISGEAGVGKTSLVRAFTAPARGDVRVLLGACDDLLTPRALGPLRDIARAGADALEEALRDGDRDAVLAGALAELADPSRPTVLVVEDVHWADDATLDVLRYLGRRVAELPSVLVLTFRDEEVGEALRRVLGALAGPWVQRVALDRLSRGAVARWAGGTTLTSATLYRLTGGNPFYVSEVLATADAGADVAVPATVVDAVLARAHRLDERTRGALDQLAVVPGAVELSLARTLLGDLDVLEPAERAGMVEVRADAVAFRHELARHALENALPASRRMTQHAHALAALAARPDADPARMVHHAAGAGDDAAVVRHGPAAAREASRVGSYAQEVALHEHVLARSHLLSPAEHAAVLLACSTAHQSMDQQAPALAATEAAVRLREELGDPVALGEAMVPLGPVLWSLLRPHEALRAVRRAVDLLQPAGDGPALAVALSWNAWIAADTDRREEGLAMAEAALATAQRVGVAVVEALPRMLRGALRVQLDDPDGMADVVAARRLAETAGQHVFVMYTHVLAAQHLALLGRWTEVVGAVEEGLAHTRERELGVYADHLLAHRHRWLAIRGEWDAAERGLREVVGRPDGGETMATRYSLPWLARLLVRRGADDAEDVLAWALDHAARADSRLLLVPALLAETEQAWLTGDPDRAQRALTRLDERTAAPGPRRDRAEVLRWRARCGAAATPDAACPEPFASGLRGDWAGAAAAWERLGDPYEQALELAGSGDVDATRRALTLLDDLGAVPAAARVRRRLRELGVNAVPRGPVPATRANPFGLTERQLDILGRLARGRTNAQIAAELVLSVRTVDHHVSAVLAKLGVSTRGEAVAAASAQGLDTG
ncbi:AAA family ATPase [Actinomycetospora lutea]|uniref:ATP-binding protein n=1 Tax=Actinomycetospora lutea TaxID=663604 RepID=UPI002366F7A1|nr:LuxR family transcriptional regulator [Actinomycetospora lutea]MDD7939129.1 AAA family ATPase [Actinomycetospora lutea]